MVSHRAVVPRLAQRAEGPRTWKIPLPQKLWRSPTACAARFAKAT